MVAVRFSVATATTLQLLFLLQGALATPIAHSNEQNLERREASPQGLFSLARVGEHAAKDGIEAAHDHHENKKNKKNNGKRDLERREASPQGLFSLARVGEHAAKDGIEAAHDHHENKKNKKQKSKRSLRGDYQSIVQLKDNLESVAH